MKPENIKFNYLKKKDVIIGAKRRFNYLNSFNRINSKAVSHLEMIISFSIFLLFIVFLFMFLNPIQQPDISKSLLKAAQNGVEKYKTTLLEIPVSISRETIGCFILENPFTTTSSSNVFIKDKNKNNVAFAINSDKITIKKEMTGKQIYNLYYVRDSSFGNPILTCTETIPLTIEEDYKYSIPRLKSLYLMSELEKLKTEYEGNYDVLKEQFNFPQSSDFSVVIRRQNSNEIKFEMTMPQPEKVSVYASESPIIVLDDTTDARIEYAYDMSIQVW